MKGKYFNPEQNTVAVIGLGYVGLPLIVEFAAAGFKGVGIDIDQSKVDAVNAGTSYIPDVPTEEVAGLVKAKRLRATTDFSAVNEADAIIICVPTPLRKTKEPDISHILVSCNQIAKYTKKGQLIILESTTYPGTTDEVIQPIFEQGGMRVGKDFYLAFSPERVDPGNPQFLTKNICKIVGGVTPECTKRAVELYKYAINNVLPTSNARVAETAKLLENTYRSVNIALVNELAQMCHYLKIDVWEVINAAATKPFGYQAFYPGPGIGGHCIPLDPYYLTWKARVSGYEAKFISLAGEVNSNMPHYVLTLISDAMNDAGKCIKGSKILILGVAYKKNVGDVRESPALEIINLLQAKGARISFADPFVSGLKIGDTTMKPAKADAKTLQDADCAVIIANHDAFDYKSIGENAKLIIDTRNAMKGVGKTKGKVVKL
jgi:UDP-N-acetyl-D-glucosamine dehydrogenase